MFDTEDNSISEQLAENELVLMCAVVLVAQEEWVGNLAEIERVFFIADTINQRSQLVILKACAINSTLKRIPRQK
jgi:hypothetical protein